MKPMDILSQFGLSNTESAVYLAALEVAHASVRDMSSKTSLNRTTLYHALQTLEDKGLIRRIGKSGVARYAAEPPEQLKILLQRKHQDLVQLEHVLEENINTFPDPKEYQKKSIDVQYVRGRQGIINIAEQVFLSQKKELLVMSPPAKKMMGTFDISFAKVYLEKRKKEGVRVKSIWQDLPGDKYIENHISWNRDIRIASVEQFGEFESAIHIFDSTVLIINFLPELLGVVIRSPAYSQSMRLLWNSVWQQAKKI